MIYKEQYGTDEEKENLKIQYQGKYLIEEQNLIVGNFLIFSDEPKPIEPVYVDVSQQEVEELKTQLAQTNNDLQGLMDYLAGQNIL